MKYLKLIALLGLLALASACGGGGGGNASTGGVGSSPPPSPPPAPPPPPPPVGTSLGVDLNEGAFWEFFGTSEALTFAQPATNTAEINVGRFRITLGTSVLIGGQTAFPLELSGDFADFAPRWTHIAVGSDGSLLGSTDGASLTTLYNALNDQWVGGGFFVEFNSSEQVDFADDTFDGNYNQVNALVARHSTADGGCEQILGRTFCDDSSMSFSEREFYKIGIGPIGYSVDATYSDSGGNFTTSFQRRTRIELIASSYAANDGTTFNLPPYQEIAPLNTARTGHLAYAATGKIYVFGGVDAAGNPLTSVEVYDSGTDSWSFSTAMPAGQYLPGGSIDGLIYLPELLSQTISVFDPVNESWSSVTPVSGMLPNMCDATTYVDVNFGLGEILAGSSCAAGTSRSLSFGGYTPSLNNTVTSGGLDLGFAELLRITVEVVGDRMFVIGGFGRTGTILDVRGSRDEVWEFGLTTDEWSTSPNGLLNQSRESHSSAVFNDLIYIFGGVPNTCSEIVPSNCAIGLTLRSAEVYDPDSGIATDLPAMFLPRSHFQAVDFEGSIFLIGGTAGNGEVTASVDRFIP